MSVINTNITSLIGQQNLKESQNSLQTSFERLSSGLRINSAKDDAAGQAVANRLTAQITGLGQAQRNANDGISIAQTAEGGLDQINENLQRIRELTVQAANGTNSQDDLTSIQDEIDQRLAEVDRISEETDFNGTKVLADGVGDLSIQVGANDNETISVGLTATNKSALELNEFGVSVVNPDTVTNADLEELVSDPNNVVSGGSVSSGADGEFSISINGDSFTFEAVSDGTATAADNEIDTSGTDVALTELFSGASADGDTPDALSGTVSGGNVVSTDTGELFFEDDDGQYFAIEAVQNEDGFNISFDDGAEAQPLNARAADPLAQLDNALNDVDSLRSELGAVQNRFDSAITNLNTNETNLTAARSRIEDADFAVEVANQTKNQILQQAGTSALAQANQLPQNVLSLLG